MAIVVVQVGQCGNQLGDELFTQLAISVASARSSDPHFDSPFFCDDGMARCVLVDSEPKVVRGVQARHESFIRPSNVICGQSGRGNNWGMGYHGVPETETNGAAAANSAEVLTHGAQGRRRRGAGDAGHRHHPQTSAPPLRQPGFQKVYKAQRTEDGRLLSRALRAIHTETRRTAESARGFEAILLLHSLAGGTGSGLASRLAEKIRYYFTELPAGQSVDERKEAAMMARDGLDGMLVEKRRARYFVNVAVAPQACGELSLQGINAALTLHMMHRFADATILLRNDDVMAPSGAISRSTTKSTNIIQRCLTFKEANEVLVSLLMPVLRYGIAPSGSDAGRRHRRTDAASPARDDDDGDGEGGVVSTVVRNCTPAGERDKVRRRTGGNTILTLLPTPQNTYESFQSAVLHCVFFTVSGGKALLPGCAATIPMRVMCAKAALPALQTHDVEAARGAEGESGSRRARGRQPTQAAQTRLSQREGGSLRGTPADARSSRGSRPAWDCDTDQPPTQRDPEVWDQGQFLNDDRPNDDGGGTRFGERGSEERGGGAVYSEVAVVMPPGLLAYYQEVKRSPVASLSTTLEGVAVLNQVRELNRSLMFPLLRSAALKVSVGAFLSTYEKAGVSSEFIVKAYQDVAEMLSVAEQL